MGSQALSGNMTTTIIITVLALANKVYHTDEEEEEEEETNLGSSAVVGLFDSLRNLNRHVGKVVRLASNIDSGLKNVGEGFHDWRQENFGMRLRRKKVTEAETDKDGEEAAEEAAEEAEVGEDGDNEVEDIEV